MPSFRLRLSAFCALAAWLLVLVGCSPIGGGGVGNTTTTAPKTTIPIEQLPVVVVGSNALGPWYWGTGDAPPGIEGPPMPTWVGATSLRGYASVQVELRRIQSGAVEETWSAPPIVQIVSSTDASGAFSVPSSFLTPSRRYELWATITLSATSTYTWRAASFTFTSTPTATTTSTTITTEPPTTTTSITTEPTDEIDPPCLGNCIESDESDLNP